MDKRLDNPGAELGEANESVSRFVAYWSTHLFWAGVAVLGLLIAFMN